MTLQSCMGGWCAKRDHCAHYHSASPDQEPAQRLCAPGQTGAYVPLNFNPQPVEPAETETENDMPRQVHIPLDQRLAAVLAMITAEGATTNEITQALGFKTRSRPAVLLRQLVADGKAFPTGAGNVSARYFPTPELRDAYAAAYRAEMAERRLANCVAASQRYRAATAIDPMAPRQPKPAKPKPVYRTKKVKTDGRPAEQQMVSKGTRTATAPKLTGPARLPGELDLSRAKITVAPTPPSRWAASTAPAVVSPRECRPWAMAAV